MTDILNSVPRGTLDRLEQLQALIMEEAGRQSLVARSTLPDFWNRHILDSLQLDELATLDGLWMDIGSGGGLPGLVIACVSERPMLLVEPRRLRAEFLRRAAVELRLPHVEVAQSRVEQVRTAPASVISARAVAATPALFAAAHHLSDATTVWLLPRGRSAKDELAAACESWQGRFRIVPSRTDPDAGIIVASHVEPRDQRP